MPNPTKEEMSKFSSEIDSMVMSTDYNYIEAIIEYCKTTGLEIEVAASLVSQNLKAKIETDAIMNNMLKEKGARLPI